MSESHPRRSLSWKLLGFIVLAACYWAVAVKTPLAVGFWQDDATYVANARALAQGSGYRHIQFPSEPLQTRYPPLYSALLSLGFRVSPDYPDNIGWLLIPSALGAAALVMLSVAYWRRVFEPPALVWVSGAGLAALSPVLLGFVRYTMSDLVYGGLVIASLLCLDQRRIDGRSGGIAELRLLLLGSVLVALSVLTRGIGISLLVAAPAALVLRRRFGEAALVFGIAAGICVPWWLWQAWASGQNGPLQHAFLTSSELSYGLWAPETLAQSLRVVPQNLLRILHDLAYYQLALPIGPATQAIVEFGWQTIALFSVCSATLLLCIVGFWQSMRSGWRTLHLYALLYGGLMIVWPFAPHRFMIPWTPFLLYFLIAGIWRSVRWGGEFAGSIAGSDVSTEPWRARGWQVGVSLVLVLLIAVSFVSEDMRILASRPDRYFIRELPEGIDLREVDEVYAWVRARVPDHEVIAAAWSAGLFLNTERRGYFLWPDSNPYARYYGPDREAWRFYGVRSRSELMSIHEEMAADLVTTYNEAGIHYYLEQPHWLEGRVMRLVIDSNPASFEKLFESSKGSYRVYRLKFPVAPMGE